MIDPYLAGDLTGDERPPGDENHPTTYDGVFRPADRPGPGSLLYPFLTNITAVRAADSTRQALSLDVVAEAFDQRVEDLATGSSASLGTNTGDFRHPSNSSSSIPEDPTVRDDSVDGADSFESQLRDRVGQLGDKALETRELSRHHERINSLTESSPSSASGRAWADAVAHTLRRASCAIETIDRDRVNDEADEILRDLKSAHDDMDRVIQSTVDRLRCVGESITSKLKENYDWVRGNSTLLGIQCATSTRCPVCLVHQVNMFIDPCGHTFCDACMSKCGDNECCVCRGFIKAKRKLFWCG
jgi:hypothetical protein